MSDGLTDRRGQSDAEAYQGLLGRHVNVPLVRPVALTPPAGRTLSGAIEAARQASVVDTLDGQLRGLHERLFAAVDMLAAFNARMLGAVASRPASPPSASESAEPPAARRLADRCGALLHRVEEIEAQVARLQEIG